MGALCHLTLQYLDWLAKQLMPDQAETVWLDRHGNIWLVNADGTTGRKQATLAVGIVAATGTQGSVVPQFTTLTAANSVTYETSTQIIIGSTATSIPIRAIDPGTVGNLPTGTAMGFAVPPPGVDKTVAVVELTGGADVETDEELRARVLQRIQEPPMGGDATDYEAWALAVPGVTRAWAAPLEEGIGTVTLRFMCDDLRSDNYGIPLAEDVARVQAYLDTKRPVAVKDFFCVAPIPFPLKIAITQLVVDSQSTRASVQVQLGDMVLTKAIPGGTIYRSWVDEAISNSIGENYHEMNYESTPMPTPGHIAILGSIIYAGG
jgi:uncharacterized phage protein gp47/JayE